MKTKWKDFVAMTGVNLLCGIMVGFLIGTIISALAEIGFII